MTASHRHWAIAGTVAAAGYAALKGAWGAGSTLGVRDPAALHAAFGGMEGLATWGTVVPAVIAVVLLWLRATRVGPQGWVRRSLWLGVALLAVPATFGFGEALGVAVGLWGDAPGSPLAPGVFVFVYGCFLVLAIAFAVLARGERRHTARTWAR